MLEVPRAAIPADRSITASRTRWWAREASHSAAVRVVPCRQADPSPARQILRPGRAGMIPPSSRPEENRNVRPDEHRYRPHRGRASPGPPDVAPSRQGNLGAAHRAHPGRDRDRRDAGCHRQPSPDRRHRGRKVPLSRRVGRAASLGGVMIRQFRLQGLGGGPAGADAGRDGGERCHREQGAQRRGDQPKCWRGGRPASGRGLEQPDAERDAEDGAWQRGKRLRRREPRAGLARVCAERARISSDACLASSTVAQAVRIALRAARVTSATVIISSICGRPGAALGHAFFWSRRQRRMPPRTAPRVPRPVMTAKLGQSGLLAGAGTMWKKTDVSRSQWLV